MRKIKQQKYELQHMYTNDDIAVPYLFPELEMNWNEIFDTWSEDWFDNST